MSTQHGHARLQPSAGPDQGTVAAAAARMLAEGDEARVLPVVSAERWRADTGATVAEDRATMATISRDLAAVHSQLDQINAAIVGLQAHSLRQTGGVALALSVLIAIAWKVVCG